MQLYILRSADEWIKDVQTARYHYKFTIIKDVLILSDYFAAFYKKRRLTESVPHIKTKTKLFQICSFPLNYLWKKHVPKHKQIKGNAVRYITQLVQVCSFYFVRSKSRNIISFLFSIKRLRENINLFLINL